jgi:hypothetical protein
MVYKLLSSSGLLLNPSLESLQALLLLYHWLDDQPSERSSSSILLAIAMRGAKNLGLNKLGETVGSSEGIKEELFGDGIRLEVRLALIANRIALTFHTAR